MTTFEFYRSREWTDLMRVLRLERVEPDGFPHCDHCGKAIAKAYDCIGHHVIELDDVNVDDAAVALNPDNIVLVHHKCHNKIHNKLGHSNTGRGVYLVYGSPLSGKSSWVSEVIEPGDLVVDMDSIWQCVSGCDRYVKDGRLNAVVFGLRDELIRMVKMRVGFWRNAYIIGGYPLSSERDRLCRQLGAREVYIDSTLDECLARLEVCEDGRDIVAWERFILEWWEKFLPQ